MRNGVKILEIIIGLLVNFVVLKEQTKVIEHTKRLMSQVLKWEIVK
jgi:hypothetical protein